MRRTLYWAGYFLALVLIVIGILVYRFLNVAGVFTAVTPISPGTCSALAGITGPEDLQIDRAAKLMFVSATDRRAPPGAPNPQDGIYLMHLDHKELGFTHLTPPAPDFHPHGLSLYVAPDGSRTLMVINHADATKSSVAIYSVIDTDGEISLRKRANITSTAMVALNDLVAVGPVQFYVANQSSARSQFGGLMEMLLLQRKAKILYYDGQVVKLAAKDLTMTFGINASPDYSRIYVSDGLRRRIDTFQGNPLTGELTLVSNQSLPAIPDNIDVDAAGNLWVAGHVKGLKLIGYGSNPAKPSPSAIYELPVSNTIPQPAKAIYVNDGGQIGASSVGAAFDGHLYIGSVYDPKILDCTLPR